MRCSMHAAKTQSLSLLETATSRPSTSASNAALHKQRCCPRGGDLPDMRPLRPPATAGHAGNRVQTAEAPAGCSALMRLIATRTAARSHG